MKVAILEEALLDEILMTFGNEARYKALQEALNRLEAEEAEVSASERFASMQNQLTINPTTCQTPLTHKLPCLICDKSYPMQRNP